MSAALLLRPDEMEAARRALERLKAPVPLPAFTVMKAVLPAVQAPPPPAPLPMPPPKSRVTTFPPGEKFVAVMEQEFAEERQAAREAAKLEPLTFTISDQQELRVLYELAARRKSKPVSMIRRHIRGWGRTELDANRAEQTGEPIPTV